MRDPYEVLGLKRGASDAEIKRAYRGLAKKHHPDQNQDDPKAKDRFAELNSAYEILGDAAKRKQFDGGQIGPDGKPKFQGFDGFGQQSQREGFAGFDFSGAGAGHGRRRGSAGFGPGDIFSEIFGEAMRGAETRSRGPSPGAGGKGPDVEITLSVTLEELVSAGKRRLKIPSGREIEVNLPAGVTDGQVIRLKGLGQMGRGGEPGDVLMTVKVLPHARFTVDGSNLKVRVPLPLEDAVLGGPVRIPTLEGEVEAKVPAMTSGGKSLRLRGKGLPTTNGRGDLIAMMDVTLPAKPDADLTELMEARRLQKAR